MSDHPTTLCPNNFDTHMAYAVAAAEAAVADAARPGFDWATGGDDPDTVQTETEYAIEPARGGSARAHDSELAGVIDELVDYRDSARLITREITYGPWRYVTPEEITGD